MRAYQEQIALAKRWDKAVDFGSPMSAWTPEMLATKKEKNHELETSSQNGQ